MTRHAGWFPWLFVLLWSTGFIGAKWGLPHASPLIFLELRYALVITAMTLIAVFTRAPWPATRAAWGHIAVAGLLVHATYLGGVFVAISKGLPAGVTSLVVGLQPLLTALGAGLWLGARVSLRQWAGLGLGLLGVTMVLSGRLGADFAWSALAPAVLALCGITAGTLYQKRFCPVFDWRTGAVAQFVPSALLTLPLALWMGPLHVDWHPDLLLALAWLVGVLSIGAISLLNWLIRHGSAVHVASLFYLVPPCTAVLAWALFGETLSPWALAGLALAVAGVALARR